MLLSSIQDFLSKFPLVFPLPNQKSLHLAELLSGGCRIQKSGVQDLAGEGGPN